MSRLIRKGYTVFSINGLIRGIYILIKISTKTILKRLRASREKLHSYLFPLVDDLIPGCCRMRSADSTGHHPAKL